MSEIARGEIELHRRAGKTIPLAGALTRMESHRHLLKMFSTVQCTFGGHKNSALSTMIELIADPVIGDLNSVESLEHDGGTKSSPYHGELIIALDPWRFLGDQVEEYLLRAETLFENIEGGIWFAFRAPLCLA